MLQPDRPIPDARWVNVVKPDGTVTSIPSYDVARMVGQGWQVETDAMRRERLVQEQFGDRGLEAALMGAARGATFGISDQLLTKMGVVDPTTAAGLAEASPGASIAGELGGIIGSTLLTKKAPAAQVGRLGQAVKAATAAKLGGGMLARVAGVAAGAGAEGAVYGAGHLVSEEALGKAEFTAENLLAYAGFGAATGAGVGGVFGMGGELAKKATIGVTKQTAKGLNRLYQAATGEAADGKMAETYRKAAKGLAKAGAFLTDAEEDAIFKGLTSKEFRNLATAGEEGLQRSTAEVTRSLEGILDIEEVAAQLTRGKLKVEQVKQLARTGNEAQVMAEANEMFARVRERLTNVLTLPNVDRTTKNKAKQALELLNGTQKMATGLEWKGPLIVSPGAAKKGGYWVEKETGKLVPVKNFTPNNGEAFALIDDLKRTLGHSSYSKAGLEVPGGPGKKVAESVRDLYDTELRAILLDAGLWGDDLARMQSTTNDIYQRMIGTATDFRRRFLMATHSDEKLVGAGKWSKKYDPNPEAVEGFLKVVGNGSGRAKTLEGLFDQQVRARLDMVKNVRANYVVDDELAAVLAKVETDAQALGAALKGSKERLAAFNQIKAMRGGGDLAMPAVGYAVAGAPGAAAAHLATRPDKVIMGLAYLDNLMAKTQGKMLGHIETFIEKASGKAAGAFAATAPVRGLIAGRVGGSQGTIDERYDREMLEVLSNVRDPQAFSRRAADEVVGLADIAPTTAQHAVIKRLGVESYLAQQLPGSTMDPSPFDDPEKPRQPSRFKKTEFLQKAEVARNPSAALEHLEAGTLTTAHVHALEANYPELYEWMRQQIMQRVSPQVRYQHRLKLAKLFRAPLDPTLVPAFINAMRPQAPVAPSHQAKGTPGGPPGAPGSNQGITIDERRMSGAGALALA